MKLYRLRYSPFARKVQMLLDLLGRPYELVEVPYDDRDELARVTGGYIYVPVLVGDDGRVTVESRRICELLLEDPAARRLTLDVLEGPVWAYADFCDGPLEDVLFRIASPRIRDAWERPGQRALYTLIKERKFGAGCIEQWERDTPALLDRARTLLSPTVRTLQRAPFLFGEAPSLADAALYGNLAMLFEADRALPGALAAELPGYMSRLERLVPSR
ncbi:glutathione S-transferase family protein [Sorangium sp. So ce363]|uniref:glutathione S-transferase family protein n=1 Tax=Sorangium sp. So ce363 TaxID=3133304 RepID=UPI003F5E2A7B